jgi:hypothetical protein
MLQTTEETNKTVPECKLPTGGALGQQSATTVQDCYATRQSERRGKHSYSSVH